MQQTALTSAAALSQTDSHLVSLLSAEEARQRGWMRLNASENHVSRAVREACSPVFTDQHSEGYPGACYYEGQQIVDAGLVRGVSMP